MSIGIMDGDMAKYTLVPFNLECMKLSAYYKKAKELVVLAPSFTPERHTKFFYRQDYNDGNFPIQLGAVPNVEYGGLAFSNNQYAPLPLEIEKMRPDPSIYAKMEFIIKETTTNANRKRIYDNMFNAEHCRLSLDGKTIWPDYARQFKMLQTARNLMIHDYDLGAINGGFDEVQKILARARTDGWATKIGMKFPVQIYDGDTLLKWSSLNSNGVFYSVRYNGIIDDETFLQWVGKIRQKAIFSQMEYYITPSSYTENDLIETGLLQIFKQVIISRSYCVFFSLKYDEDFFTDPRWGEVIQLFDYYHNSLKGEPRSYYLTKITDDTMFDFASACSDKPHTWYGQVFTKTKIRELFAFVRAKNYELFKAFYECTARKLGGN